MHTDVLKRSFPKVSGFPVVVGGPRDAVAQPVSRVARRRVVGARRLAVALLAPLALIALAALVATTGSHSRTTNAFAPLVTQRTLSTANGYPAVGGTAVTVVTGSGGPFADDTVTEHTTVTGHPTASQLTFTGTEAGGLAGTTLHATFTGTATRHADGSLTIVDRGSYGGGTYTLTCSMPAGAGVCRGPLNRKVG
jgi:hypothetical protein